MESAQSGSGPSPKQAMGGESNRAARPWPRWLPFSGLQAELVIPYVLLTLLLAVVGTYIVTRLVSASIHERFANRLYDASRVAAYSISRQEQEQLADLRTMAFTEGVLGALSDGDTAKLKELLYPLVLNSNVDILAVVAPDGQEIVTWGKDPKTGQYIEAQGGDFSSYEPVQKVLKGVVDENGDKHAGIANTSIGPAMVTSAPVRTPDGELAGVLVIGSYLQSILGDLSEQIMANLVVLDANKDYLASTLPNTEETTGLLEEVAKKIALQGEVATGELSLPEGDYRVSFVPFLLREQPLGWLGVILPGQYVVAGETTSRNVFTLIFAIATLAVIALGYFLARHIARPILRLRTISQDVALGNLDQKSGVTRSDEIGDLAIAFDQMTSQLRQRTAEAERLYSETAQRNRELIEINARLQSMQLQLIQSEKLAAIGQLTAGIVHDVKNPLTVIKGMAEILQENENLDAATQKDLKVIGESAVKANRIVTDLLKFARQSAPEMQSRDLRETVDAALRLTAYMVREAGIQLVTDLPKNPVIVTYDALQIEQVIINLIKNAVQAMPERGKLTVSLRSTGTEVALIVQDTGVGIAPENLSRIFDPFFSTKLEGEGTGLGLSLSYGIVANHKGRIEVESEVGKGTTFTVVLPTDQVATVEG